MLTKEEFEELFYQIGYEIDYLDGNVDTVPLNLILNKMGFPSNWRDLIKFIQEANIEKIYLYNCYNIYIFYWMYKQLFYV